MTKKPTYDELEKRVEEQAAEIVKLSERLKRKITEHRQSGGAQREGEERFRVIFETAEDSIFIKNRRLKYTLVNPAMERLFGLPASQLLEKSDEQLFGNKAPLLSSWQ